VKTRSFIILFLIINSIGCGGGGNLVAPVTNQFPSSSQNSVVLIEGDKPEKTGVVVNGTTVSALDETDHYSLAMTLHPGVNQLQIQFVDEDQNLGEIASHNITYAPATNSPIPQPRLITPTADERIVTLFPTFRWTSAGIDQGTELYRYSVQISSNASFGSSSTGGDIANFDAATNLIFTPTLPIGAGKRFWRVCATSVQGSSSNSCSVSQLFYVGRNPSDLNGDGLGDLAVGAPLHDYADLDSGSVNLLFGKSTDGTAAANSFGVTPYDQRLVGFEREGHFGASVAQGIDLNHDGIGDLIVGAPGIGVNSFGETQHGKVFIYYGVTSGTTTLAYVPDITLAPDAGSNIIGFGRSITPIGDFNGDELEDFAVGAPDGDTGGCVLIYCGAATGTISNTPCTILVRETNSNDASQIADGFGSSVARLGDFNGDGHADLAVGAEKLSESGTVFVYYGGPQVNTHADLTFSGSTVAGGMDANGDGFTDLVVSDAHSQHATLIFGREITTNSADIPKIILHTMASPKSLLLLPPENLASTANLLVGVPKTNNGDGKVFLINGKKNWSTSADLTLDQSFSGEGSGENFGSTLTTVVDNNLQSHFVVGSPFGELYNFRPGKISLFDLSSKQPQSTLFGDNEGDQFGDSLSCFR
jgi:hypothetical protein